MKSKQTIDISQSLAVQFHLCLIFHVNYEPASIIQLLNYTSELLLLSALVVPKTETFVTVFVSVCSGQNER